MQLFKARDRQDGIAFIQGDDLATQLCEGDAHRLDVHACPLLLAGRDARILDHMQQSHAMTPREVWWNQSCSVCAL